MSRVWTLDGRWWVMSGNLWNDVLKKADRKVSCILPKWGFNHGILTRVTISDLEPVLHEPLREQKLYCISEVKYVKLELLPNAHSSIRLSVLDTLVHESELPIFHISHWQ